MGNKYRSTHWGRLNQFEIPHLIVQEDQLILKPAALSVLLILFETAKAQQKTDKIRTPGVSVTVKIKQTTIQQRSGYSKNVVTDALTELETQRFIRRRDARNLRGEFATKIYLLCDPLNGQPLTVGETSNIFVGSDVRYIKLPRVLVKGGAPGRMITDMTGSELKTYVALCWLANRHESCSFEVTAKKLRKLAGLSKVKIVEDSLARLEARNLLIDNGNYISLFDPLTAEPIHVQDGDPSGDPRNYWATDEHGSLKKRWNTTMADPGAVERFLREFGAEPVPQQKGDYKINCPYHSDSTPSCSVSPGKTCFYCFGCRKKGTLTQLLMKLSGWDEGSTRMKLAELAGHHVRYVDPLHDAEAVYQYYDAEWKLIKEVIRRPDKKFVQRRPGPTGGWIPNVDGVRPILYNLPRLRSASVICVCEGEKDCESLRKQNLFDGDGGDVVATASGHAESWLDHLADDLVGKKVILMPDSDEAGERYRAAVEASLQSRGIDYRVCAFADAGAKDVSDFITAGGTKKDLVERIGSDWIRTAPPSPIGIDDNDPDAPEAVI